MRLDYLLDGLLKPFVEDTHSDNAAELRKRFPPEIVVVYLRPFQFWIAENSSSTDKVGKFKRCQFAEIWPCYRARGGGSQVHPFCQPISEVDAGQKS